MTHRFGSLGPFPFHEHKKISLLITSYTIITYVTTYDSANLYFYKKRYLLPIIELLIYQEDFFNKKKQYKNCSKIHYIHTFLSLVTLREVLTDKSQSRKLLLLLYTYANISRYHYIVS